MITEVWFHPGQLYFLIVTGKGNAGAIVEFEDEYYIYLHKTTLCLLGFEKIGVL